MKKIYIVSLTAEERQMLKQLIRSGVHRALKITRARIFLKADQGPAWTDPAISQALAVGRATVERLRKRLVEEGLEAALKYRPRRSAKPRRKLDGHQEAQLVALAWSDPPEGRSRWSVRLLATHLVELEVVATIS